MAATLTAPSREQRLASGLAARKRVPFESHAGWQPAVDRPDPVDLLLGQATTRMPDLVPVRHGRMAASPFSFYRGAALPMAADLSVTPSSGLIVQLCGDAHMSNFGLFASPERKQVFDINDFDETLHGPFEWDVKRLAASLMVAGRERGFAAHDARHVVAGAVRAYRERMTEYATLAPIAVYYSQVDVESVLAYVDKRARPFLRDTVRKATHHDALHELPKLTEVDASGQRRIVDHPPIIAHVAEAEPRLVQSALAGYRETLLEDRRVLLDRYTFVDAAMKVVGVGSVGLGAMVGLFLADGEDPLFLQVKQAEASVLERFLPATTEPSPGARVVAGQRRLQATTDILLGWTTGEHGRHWYVRQLQDQKGGAVLEAMTLDDLAAWAELCGWALARGHARSGDPAELAGYLGSDDQVDRAMTSFATVYADQNERDYTSFVAAIAAGRVQAQEGV
jgi:uncharacterized protein (DUF2252 family)